MSQRVWAWGATALVVVGLGLVPVLLDRDSYPHSTFPMFSSRRTSTESVATAVAIGPSGVQRLDPSRIAATDEVILAAATVDRAVRAGTVDQLCREIAGRVAERGPTDADQIEVVTERYDALRWYDGDHEPIQRVVHAQCPVER